MALVSFIFFAMMKPIQAQHSCNAASSCSGTGIQAQFTDCRGGYSCNTSSISAPAPTKAASYIYANGASSWANGRSTLHSHINCNGEQSCAYSHAEDMQVYRFGPD